ncbi:hypothetical protein KXW60_002742 [Aspergillus fumigatus]|nr:hypothetical protein KXW88_009137 [Aspergillus fumigatus]KAH3007580.1 hypothetical protein KXW60_002742 [Aspergillus fumigatus]
MSTALKKEISSRIQIPNSLPLSEEQALTLRRVTLEYTSQAAKAFNNAFTASNEAKQGGSAGSKFRFVYVSGGLAERDQSKPLWFSAGFRRVRGQAENILLEHEAAHSTTFESYILRPGLVLTRQGTFTDRIRGLVPSVRVDVLARRAIDIVVEGHSKRMWENAQINEWKGVHGRHT